MERVFDGQGRFQTKEFTADESLDAQQFLVSKESFLRKAHGNAPKCFTPATRP